MKFPFPVKWENSEEWAETWDTARGKGRSETSESLWYVGVRTSFLQDTELSGEGFNSCLERQRFKQIGDREMF